jgi:hypothetical protein
MDCRVKLALFSDDDERVIHFTFRYAQMLHSIVQMVDRCRRTMVALKEQCRRDHAAAAAPGGGQTIRTSPGSDISQANMRLVDDLHVLQVRQLAGARLVRYSSMN